MASDHDNLDNYRPTSIFQTIYKIRETAITRRLSPIMTLQTRDNQCDYKEKTTLGAIYYIERNLVTNKIIGRISFGL